MGPGESVHWELGILQILPAPLCFLKEKCLPGDAGTQRTPCPVSTAELLFLEVSRGCCLDGQYFHFWPRSSGPTRRELHEACGPTSRARHSLSSKGGFCRKGAEKPLGTGQEGPPRSTLWLLSLLKIFFKRMHSYFLTLLSCSHFCISFHLVLVSVCL